MHVRMFMKNSFQLKNCWNPSILEFMYVLTPLVPGHFRSLKSVRACLLLSSSVTSTTNPDQKGQQS